MGHGDDGDERQEENEDDSAPKSEEEESNADNVVPLGVTEPTRRSESGNQLPPHDFP